MKSVLNKGNIITATIESSLANSNTDLINVKYGSCRTCHRIVRVVATLAVSPFNQRSMRFVQSNAELPFCMLASPLSFVDVQTICYPDSPPLRICPTPSRDWGQTGFRVISPLALQTYPAFGEEKKFSGSLSTPESRRLHTLAPKVEAVSYTHLTLPTRRTV